MGILSGENKGNYPVTHSQIKIWSSPSKVDTWANNENSVIVILTCNSIF